MQNGIKYLVKEIVAKTCNENCTRPYHEINAKKISGKHNLKNDLPVDSLIFTEILAKIEDRFYFNFKDDVINKLITVGNLIQSVEILCQKGG